MSNVSVIKKALLFGGVLAVSVFAAIAIGPKASVGATSCVDGKQPSDFKGSFVSKDTIKVTTATGGKLCNDVNVNFTSFTLPLTYNGKGFQNNPTAIPQYKFATKTVTLKKGTDGTQSVTVPIPNECTPYQLDAYLGPEQTSVTTSAGLKAGTAIIGKVFDKTKTDCTVPKVDACNTKTGVIEKVEKGKENTPPYSTDFSKCKVDACNTQTGVIEKVIRGQENVAPHTTDFDKCRVSACDTSTGTIVRVDKGKENTAPYTTNLDKCEFVRKCDTTNRAIVRITKDEAKDTTKYVDENSDVCKLPKEVPSTGPVEVVSTVAGISSVAGAGSMYLRSRRALKR